MAFEEPPHKAIPSGGVTRIHQVHSAIEFEKKCNFLRNLHHLHQGLISKLAFLEKISKGAGTKWPRE